MKAERFVYNTVHSKLLAHNLPESRAGHYALKALEKYKRNEFGRVVDLIDEIVKEGKRLK